MSAKAATDIRSKPWGMPAVWCQLIAPYLHLWELGMWDLWVFISRKAEEPLLVMVSNPGLTPMLHVELLVALEHYAILNT